MKHSLSMVLFWLACAIGVNLFFCGCSDAWLQPAQDAIDTLYSSVTNAPSTVIQNENWMALSSEIKFNHTKGVSWVFTESEYGNTCDCASSVTYSSYTASVSASNDSSIYLDSAQKIEIPIVDTFSKVDTQPNLGSLSPIPRVPQTNYPIFIDDDGNKVLFCASGSEHGVYYEPYGLIYSRSYSSCGAFCGHRYTTILSKYNGSSFDYLKAISVSKGLYEKWIQFQKTDKYTLLVRDSSSIKSITFDRYPIWSKGDSIVSKRSQIPANGQLQIQIQGIDSSSEYLIPASPIDSLIVTAPVNGLQIKDRKIEPSFF